MLQNITTKNFDKLLGQFTTSQLEGLVERAPYFQQAHLLLAKKYQLENDPRFDQQLQIAALYTQDRDLLFELFNEKIVVTPKIVQQTYVEPVIGRQEENIVAADEIVSNPVEDVAEEQKEPEALPVAEKELIALPAAEPVIALTEHKEEEPAIEAIATAEQPEEVTEAIVEEESFSTSEPHYFGDWLKAFNKLPSIERIEEPTTDQQKDEELDRLIATSGAVDYLHDLVKEETNYSKGLDKFIEAQIQKHKHGVSVSKPSETELSADLVTETMAKVYEMQKKYNKAIKAYEILTLKFPEKNDFFAARINYLKNII